MFFHTKKGKHNQILSLRCGDDNVEFVEETKLLGVVIDHKLKFTAHINHLCKKANSKAYLIKKSLFLFNFKFRVLLFKLFIIPHFDYCASLFIYLKKR